MIPADEILETYIQTKVRRCLLENGPTDIKAMVHAKPAALEGGVIWLLATPYNPTDALPLALAGIVAQHGPLEWAGFLSDAHVSDALPGAPEPARGAFARDYDSNPASVVREALILTWRAVDGESGMSVAMYSYPDGPLPVFDPVAHHRLARGAADRALRAVMP